MEVSKTNVTGRKRVNNKKCKYCKNDVDVVLYVSVTGRKKMLRKYCEK